MALGVLSRELGVIHKARGDLPATLATLLVLLRSASLEGLAASVDGAAAGKSLVQGASCVHVAVQEEVLVVADDADLVDALGCAANAFDGDDADLGGVHSAGGAEEGDGAGEDSGELHFDEGCRAMEFIVRGWMRLVLVEIAGGGMSICRGVDGHFIPQATFETLESRIPYLGIWCSKAYPLTSCQEARIEGQDTRVWDKSRSDGLKVLLWFLRGGDWRDCQDACG